MTLVASTWPCSHSSYRQGTVHWVMAPPIINLVPRPNSPPPPIHCTGGRGAKLLKLLRRTAPPRNVYRKRNLAVEGLLRRRGGSGVTVVALNLTYPPLGELENRGFWCKPCVFTCVFDEVGPWKLGWGCGRGWGWERQGERKGERRRRKEWRDGCCLDLTQPLWQNWKIEVFDENHVFLHVFLQCFR